MEEQKNSKLVYLLAAGEYSDYHVVGVFSDMGKAHRLIKDYPNEGWHEIHEVVVDCADAIPTGLKLHYVRMEYNGNSNIYRSVPDMYMKDIEDYKLRLNTENSRHIVLEGYVLAKDKRHAAKIANEKRAQLIASGAWSKLKKKD